MKQANGPRRYVRMNQLVGRPRAEPPVPGLLPMSSATVWRMVARGEFPAPVKLGPRMTAWPVEAIQDWLKQREGASQ